MILPSDSDPPPDRNDGDDPSEEPDDPTNWWDETDPDADADGDDEFDDPEDLPPALQTVAGPGWRTDLYKDLLDSLKDLEAIEDPDDEFAPPEPPDLYTFFGELAALRNELRHQGQRANDQWNQLEKSLTPLVKANAKAGKAPASAPAPPASNSDHAGAAAAAASAWTTETRLALISLFDLLPKTASPAAFEAAFQPLLQAAGLERIPTVGLAFDAARMTLAGTAPAPATGSGKSAKSAIPAGHVLEEKIPGFLHQAVLLRPAAVIVASA